MDTVKQCLRLGFDMGLVMDIRIALNIALKLRTLSVLVQTCNLLNSKI